MCARLLGEKLFFTPYVLLIDEESVKTCWQPAVMVPQAICCFTLCWQLNSAAASASELLPVMFEEAVHEVWKLECSFICIEAEENQMNSSKAELRGLIFTNRAMVLTSKP